MLGSFAMAAWWITKSEFQLLLLPSSLCSLSSTMAQGLQLLIVASTLGGQGLHWTVLGVAFWGLAYARFMLSI